MSAATQWSYRRNGNVMKVTKSNDKEYIELPLFKRYEIQVHTNSG
jgi:hypothetical protein